MRWLELKSGVGDGSTPSKEIVVSPGSGRDVGAGSGRAGGPSFCAAYNGRKQNTLIVRTNSLSKCLL